MCVIADAAQSVAIGGVMAAPTSEISATTSNVLLESAWFDPISVRRTSKALGLRTEASMRFERGADPGNGENASRRCASLIRELAVAKSWPAWWTFTPDAARRWRWNWRARSFWRVMGADVAR